jgi:hypothetical protein
MTDTETSALKTCSGKSMIIILAAAKIMRIKERNLLLQWKLDSIAPILDVLSTAFGFRSILCINFHWMKGQLSKMIYG